MSVHSFDGPYRFLSNFASVRVEYEGLAYPSVENAYQAAKADPGSRLYFTTMTAAQAKLMGRRWRPADWDSRKLAIMEGLLRQKFAPGTSWARRLADIDGDIVEGNTWGDTFWGAVDGVGENHLGRLLMTIRDELREKS